MDLATFCFDLVCFALILRPVCRVGPEEERWWREEGSYKPLWTWASLAADRDTQRNSYSSMRLYSRILLYSMRSFTALWRLPAERPGPSKRAYPSPAWPPLETLRLGLLPSAVARITRWLMHHTDKTL